MHKSYFNLTDLKISIDLIYKMKDTVINLHPHVISIEGNSDIFNYSVL